MAAPAARRLCLSLVLGTALVSAAPAEAADWNGSLSTDWFTAGNWTPSGVPTTTTDVTINVSVGNTPSVSAAGAVADSIDLGVNAGQSGTLSIAGGTVTLPSLGAFPQGYILIGDLGTGTVTVSAGGSLTAGASYIAANANGAIGTVTVTGAGSQWNTGNFDVGSSGTGTLNVLSGGHVVATGMNVGNDNGAVGNVNLSGTGSQISLGATGELQIGGPTGSAGTVTVGNGATFNTGFTIIGTSAGSTGTLTVTGPGSTFNNTFTAVGMFIGLSGSGALNVLNGGLVNVGTGIAAAASTSSTGSATITVSGAGSTFENGTLRLGTSGPGTMTISDGGLVTTSSSASNAVVVGGNGANGSVTVRDAGSRWTVTGGIDIGSTATATGTLIVQNGGAVSANNMSVGYTTTANTGSVTVTGANASLTTTNGFVVGDSGTGTLTISNGGAVTNGTATLGSGTGSSGVATVTGAGSVWNTTSSGASFGLASFGTGVLTITQGGAVNVDGGAGDLVMAAGAGSMATLNIGAAAASAAAAPGTLNAAEIDVATAGGTGTINFNHTSSNYVFAPAITGPAIVNIIAGTTIFTGANTYTGTTTISSGAVLQIGNGGTTGSMTGNVTDNGGGAIIFDRSDTLTYGGVISSGGSLQQAGSGTTILTGANTYTGGTTISAGTLQIGSNGTTGSIAGNVLDNSHIIFDRANSLTYTGVISGSGTFEKQGSGTMTLTGANSYTGGTTITAGTLQLGASNRLAATGALSVGSLGTFALAGFSQTVGDLSGVAFSKITLGSGTLTAGAANNTTFAGVVSGTGSFVKQGAGDLSLTATNTFTGATAVDAGTLTVNGSIASSSLTSVNNGGTLSGTGTVGAAHINSGGSFAPGSGIPGTSMTVSGNLTFAPGAIYLVSLNPSTTTMTNVTGTASLAGTVHAFFASGTYMVPKTYDILHSAGLGGTTFSSMVVTVPPNFQASLSYSATDAFLNLTAILGLHGNLNVNQQNVANTLNTFFNSGGSLPPNFATIFGLTGPVLANALTQLSGEDATGAERGAFDLMTQFLNLMLDPYVDGRGGDGMATPFVPEREAPANGAVVLKAPPRQSFDQRWTAWGAGFGGYNKTNGDPIVGSNNVVARDFGFAAGMDYHFSPDMLAGFSLAGGGTNWGLAQAAAGAMRLPAAFMPRPVPVRLTLPPHSPSPITGSPPAARRRSAIS